MHHTLYHLVPISIHQLTRTWCVVPIQPEPDITTIQFTYSWKNWNSMNVVGQQTINIHISALVYIHRRLIDTKWKLEQFYWRRLVPVNCLFHYHLIHSGPISTVELLEVVQIKTSKHFNGIILGQSTSRHPASSSWSGGCFNLTLRYSSLFA